MIVLYYRHFHRSRERKPRDYRTILLTPENRRNRIAYLHQSREDSIDNSSSIAEGRGIGMSPPQSPNIRVQKFSYLKKE